MASRPVSSGGGGSRTSSANKSTSTQKPNNTTTTNKNKETQKPGEAKTTDKADISKEAKKPGEGDKNGEVDKMRGEVDELKKLLEEMGKKPGEEKKPEEGGGGGSCGGAKEGGDKGQGQGDVNDLLIQDVMAVKAEKLGQMAGNLAGGQNPQQGAGQVPGIGGAGGGNPLAGALQQPRGGAPGAGGGFPGGAKAKLQQDYMQAKQGGAQIRKEVEQAVMQELGIAPPGGQQQGQQGLPQLGAPIGAGGPKI